MILLNSDLKLSYEDLGAIMGKLPNPTQRVFDKRFTDDRFGFFVPDASLDGDQAKLLKSCGAQELRMIEAET